MRIIDFVYVLLSRKKNLFLPTDYQPNKWLYSKQDTIPFQQMTPNSDELA